VNEKCRHGDSEDYLPYLVLGGERECDELGLIAHLGDGDEGE
jgi:hypothetical protein